ncbi:auxin-responsive protein SAUR32-like [Argentina anserina]|uniref:auxin-responsive protein SAUR32-like n=1 Tax=Argentina anserina TaxID=57926 RepID=UPI00217671F9|nr:auxin-responsive protein SAUR32-like [Potentilla anserina]
MSSPQFSQTKNTMKAEDSTSNLRKLWLKIEKIQKGLSLLTTRGPPDHLCSGCDETLKVAAVVPEDVKEGYFAVFAVVGKETTRFVTKLASLNDPAFMNLLEQAQDEYGFQQKGALEVYCRPEELHSILENCRMEQSGYGAANDDNILITTLEGYKLA